MSLKQLNSRLLILVLLIAGAGMGYWLGTITGQAEPVYAGDDPQSFAVPDSISLDSPIEEILMLMLHSNEKWQSVEAHGEIEDSAGHQISHDLVVLQESPKGPYFVRGEFGLRGKNKSSFYVLDGENLWRTHADLKIYTSQPYWDDGVHPPETLRAINSPENPIVSHPLEGQFGSPLIELLFPMVVAQSLYLDVNNVSILKMDEVAGRQTIVLQWSPYPGKNLFWVDVLTGSILKREYYSAYTPEGLPIETWYERIEITKIAFDVDISPSEFQFQQIKGARFIQPFEFEKMTSEDWMLQLEKQLLEKGDEQ
jgi:outer membrane lipoprotein-sorting protein